MSTATISREATVGPSSSISTHHTILASPAPGIPSFHFHLTRLVDTLFIWVGVSEGNGQNTAPIGGMGLGDEDAAGGSAVKPDERKLASDWAVAMPSRGNIPVTATHIYKSGAGDIALSMSQRLARRFPSNQIHLSLSLPSSLTAQNGPSSDPYASRHLLMMEKKLGTWLGELLVSEKA